MAGAKWGWGERGAQVRADGVGERIVGGGMEDEGRKGRWACQVGLMGLGKDFGFTIRWSHRKALFLSFPVFLLLKFLSCI